MSFRHTCLEDDFMISLEMLKMIKTSFRHACYLGYVCVL